MKDTDLKILIRIDERTLRFEKDISTLMAKVDTQNGRVRENEKKIDKLRVVVWTIVALLAGGGGTVAAAPQLIAKLLIGG